MEGNNTLIRDLMEIDGYYYTFEYPDSNCLMFFEDGTWVAFSFKRDIPESERKANMSEYVESELKNKQFNWGNYWGVYKIANDTIVLHLYRKGSLLEGWTLYEENYKIINKKTIVKLNFRGLLKRDNFNKLLNEEYYFVSADSLPSSDCWLKEEKWIWRNESDWKAYMDRIKQMKAQNKK